MRHRVRGRTLGRKTNHRIAMWRNMAESLFTHGMITTTLPKAKSVQPFVEKLITHARKDNLHARRRVTQMLGRDRVVVVGEDDERVERNRYGEIVGGPRMVKHLFEDVAPRFADRPGGYTRIIKLSKHRIGDGTELCVLMLVGEEEQGGPQVAGNYSRRREKAFRRSEFAAQRRKAAGAAKAANADAAAVEQADPQAGGADESEPQAEAQGVEAQGPGEAPADNADGPQPQPDGEKA